MKTITFWILPLLAASACVQPDPTPRFTPAWEPFHPSQEEGWNSTRPALIVSDCQTHNLLSLAVPDRNLSVEAMAATAIRPPQLDLFAPDVLTWILKEGASDAEVVVHLGDALDLACMGELETFLDVMDGGGKPWFMAPGNHDSYYFGSYDPQDLELWDMACNGAGERVDKERFIRHYLAALIARDDGRSRELAEALGLAGSLTEPRGALSRMLPIDFEWRASGATPGFLERILWHIDPEKPWRSFLLQSVDITRPDAPTSAHIVLMDSCQYGRRPELIPNAWKSWPLSLNCGYTGEMLPDQLRAVRAWIDGSPSTDKFVIACHHPFDNLAPYSRSALGWLWRERSVGLMLSGHTHSGFFEHHDLGGDVDELELNLGSSTDWPMEWRILTGYVQRERHLYYIKAERHTLVGELEHRTGFFELAWEVPLGAPDDYRKYKQGEAANGLMVDFYLAHHLTPYWLPQPHVRANDAARDTEEQVKNTLLWTYARLVTLFPTCTSARAPAWPQGCTSDADVVARISSFEGSKDVLPIKIDLLGELAAFEKSRSTCDPATGAPTDEERLRFKLSQACWASRFEASRGRRLRLEDELIRVDWDRSQLGNSDVDPAVPAKP